MESDITLSSLAGVRAGRYIYRQNVCHRPRQRLILDRSSEGAGPVDSHRSQRRFMEGSRYRYLVRLPLLMREQLAKSAEYHRRSINSEIVARLHLSFSGLPEIAERQALAPAMHEHFELLLKGSLKPEEEQLVRRYRSLSDAKRQALLDLLS
jgi:hypothetical protein